MRKNHRHRRRRLSGAAIAVVLVCAALLYAGVLLGIMLLIIAVCKPLRRSLHRKFFI